MKAILYKLLVAHWKRKTLSLLLATIIWLVVNHSLTTIRTISNVSVRVINLPPAKTVEGIDAKGLLNKKLSLTLTGKEDLLDELSDNDLEVVLDATGQPDEWLVSLSKQNLAALNPKIDLSKGVDRAFHPSFILRLTNLISEKIPVTITSPIGEPPKGYQFIDIWPYSLMLSLKGSEEMMKQLKNRGLTLTLNLSDITKEQLDSLEPSRYSSRGDEVSYFVPESWKQISIPMLSDEPIVIDDPQAKELRIDFIRSNLLPIGRSIPINLFFPLRFSDTVNSKNVTLIPTTLVKTENSLFFIDKPLYTKGVSAFFLEIVRDMLEINLVVTPKKEMLSLDWSVQFLDAKTLENRFVSIYMSDSESPEHESLGPHMLEEHLRNRFRTYMNNFILFEENGHRLKLNIDYDGSSIAITEKS